MPFEAAPAVLHSPLPDNIAGRVAAGRRIEASAGDETADTAGKPVHSLGYRLACCLEPSS